MSKTKSTQARGKYTLEFKLEAARLVRKGQSVAVTLGYVSPATYEKLWLIVQNNNQIAA